MSRSDSELTSAPPNEAATVHAAATRRDDAAPGYLVLRSAGRWSDLFRLSRGQDVVIGRSSQNQITVRSERASRQHSRVSWTDGRWQVEDLGSRNGTLLNGRPVEGPEPLRDQDVIGVAGFEITFTTQLEPGKPSVTDSPASSQATDDQLTLELDASTITDRRRRSRHLHGGGPSRDASAAASSSLLRLAFALARHDTTREAAENVLETLIAGTRASRGGIYLCDATKPAVDLTSTLVATRPPAVAAYRHPPDSIATGILRHDGEAILARNVGGDRSLAAADSRGEVDAACLIVAPIGDAAGNRFGLIHLIAAAGDPQLTTEDLEYVVAAGEIFGESLAAATEKRRLDRSLKRTRQHVQELQRQLGHRVRLVGHSPAIEEIHRQISLAAPTPATILIRGESGVGKELVAAAIHHASPRRDGPLVCLNCAALSPSLLESELFGHEKGAFTGATERKQGKFEAADGGTLMLDEIGEMTADLQAKFLRVLEGHPFERIGGHRPIRTDVRVVAATNRDLQAMVRDGAFRQDLYYRLHVIEIVVPPLRDRGDDCIELAEFFLQRFNREMGRKIKGLTEKAKRQLLDYRWPGNIRELKNVIERAVVLNTKDVIDGTDLALAPAAPGITEPPSEPAEPVETSLADLERAHIERVLRHTGGNKSRAASILGIERSTLDRKLKRYASR